MSTPLNGRPPTGRCQRRRGDERAPSLARSCDLTPIPALVPALCVALTSVSSAVADPPPGNQVELQRLNRANEAALREIQRPSGPPPWAPQEKSVGEKAMDRRQQVEQRRLQERQRRDLLILNHRARTTPRPGLPPSLQGIDTQLRFRLEQQNQLNRFRLRRPSPRP